MPPSWDRVTASLILSLVTSDESFGLAGPAEILAETVSNVVVIILRRRGEVPDDQGKKAEG